MATRFAPRCFSNSPLLSAKVRVERCENQLALTHTSLDRDGKYRSGARFIKREGLRRSQTNAAFNRFRSALQRPRRRRQEESLLDASVFQGDAISLPRL